MKIALLKSRSLDGFISDDSLLYAELKNKYDVNWVVWDESQDWDQFDLAIVRNTWDYHQKIESFLGVLGKIDNSSCHLMNPLTVIQKNWHKKYLLEFQKKGVPTVPSVNFNVNNYEEYFEKWNCQKLLLKPYVSASAFGIVFLEKGKALPSSLPKEGLLQPFQSEITKGETSLIFFDGQLSHSVLKSPKKGDFRIQAEYGGIFKRIVPDDSLVSLSQEILPQDHLFARCDWIRLKTGWALMELELIEPALYFSFAPESVSHLVKAIETKVKKLL